MRSSNEILADLGQFADQDIPLVEAALALAAVHRTDPDVELWRDRLHALATTVRTTLPIKPRAEEMVAVMAEVLCRRHGFANGGDVAEAHELPELLSQRRGGTDLLAVVWLVVAEMAGLPCEMLGFPLRALLRFSDDNGGRAIVECDDGRVLDSPGLRMLHKIDLGPDAELDPDFFLALSARVVLLRWRHAIKLHYLRHGQMAEALTVVESALLFAPNQAALWREAGLMRWRMDDLPGAAAALEQFVQREDNALARGRGQQLLAEVRARMN